MERTYEKDRMQLTSYTVSAHSYTHLDAPLHMAGPDKKSITDYPVEYFIGEASLINLPRGRNEPITGNDLELGGKHCKDGDIVFIRTGWLEKMWGKEIFIDSPYLTEDAADWLVKLKARIAGYDFNHDHTEDHTIHRIMLANEVLNLEYVNHLSLIDVPRFQVFALPIKFQDFDGAPCRPVAVL
jgi:kynurenine formamidase